MNTIEVQNEYFHIKNKVYSEDFSISKELQRYKLINKYIAPNYRELIYFALCYEKPRKDPFLIKIKNPKNLQYLSDKDNLNKSIINNKTIRVYNKFVEKIIKKLRVKRENSYYKIRDVYDKNILTLKYKTFRYQAYIRDYLPKHKERLFCCFLRYDVLGFLNNSSTAVLPEIYQRKLNEGYKVELFGSFFNHYMPYYFGLFYDLEQPFGCLGNFYTSKLLKGKFVSNPPFMIIIINTFFLRIKKFIRNIEVFITIPLWYIPFREFYNQTHKDKLKTDYQNDLKLDILEKYIICKKLYSKKEYLFFNYLENKEINISPILEFTVSGSLHNNDRAHVVR